MKINLICPDNGWGLSRDANILKRALSEKHSVHAREPNTGPQLADVNIFVETALPQWFEFAEHQVMIPNAEWTKNWWSCADRLDLWCKTEDAVAWLGNLAYWLGGRRPKSCQYLGFTSVDRMDGEVKRANEFLHLAGRSNMRQSQLIIDTWEARPKWPFLTVVRDPERPLRVPSRAPNISVVHKKLEDATVRELQNRCRFHLCTSTYEGFGHYINEALSCGAIPLVAAAPPMSEVVPQQAGLYIKVARTTSHQHVTLKYIDRAGFEECVERALDLSVGAVEALSSQAREVYLGRDHRFHARLAELVGELE